MEKAVLHTRVEAARALRLERRIVGVSQVEAGGWAKAGAEGSVQPRAAPRVRGGHLVIDGADGLRRKDRTRIAIGRNGAGAHKLAAHASVNRPAAGQLKTVLEVEREIVAADREGVGARIGDVSVAHFLDGLNRAQGHRVPRLDAGGHAPFGLAAKILVEAEPVGAGVAVVVEEERGEQVLLDAAREQVRLVMSQVIGRVVLAAADGVDACVVVIGIGAIGAGLADGVGIEVAMEVQRLAAETA